MGAGVQRRAAVQNSCSWFRGLRLRCSLRSAGVSYPEEEIVWLGQLRLCWTPACCYRTQSAHHLVSLPAMGLELYLDLLSQPSRAVYIFAKKNGIPFQTRTVDILKGQHMSEQFSQVNCLNKVPVLKDGSFVLTESTAILIYLSSKYQVADHWYPADLQARAQVHEYLGWHADNIRGTFGVLLWTKVLGPLIGVQVPQEKVERNRDRMVLVLQQLEDKFLRDRAFLVGQQVTLADLMSLEELMQPVALGYNLFEGRPQLTAWRERVEAFLGAELCQEAHSTILSILGQAAKKMLPVPPPEVHASMQLRIARIP